MSSLFFLSCCLSACRFTTASFVLFLVQLPSTPMSLSSLHHLIILGFEKVVGHCLQLIRSHEKVCSFEQSFLRNFPQPFVVQFSFLTSMFRAISHHISTIFTFYFLLSPPPASVHNSLFFFVTYHSYSSC